MGEDEIAVEADLIQTSHRTVSSHEVTTRDLQQGQLMDRNSCYLVVCKPT